jgi:hypothetical protein
VLMLHGAYDPHPGLMIRTSLQPYMPKLEYREWADCGHKPWLEKAVREEFFTVLREWLYPASDNEGISMLRWALLGPIRISERFFLQAQRPLNEVLISL